MESLEHATKRGAPIIAEYLGGAINCDAYHMTDPRADGLGVSTCIERSLEDAGVSPEEVLSASLILSYVSACFLALFVELLPHLIRLTTSMRMPLPLLLVTWLR